MLAILPHFRNPLIPWILLNSVLGIAVILALSTGAYTVSWTSLLNLSLSEQDWMVLLDIRLPRIILAGLVGGILAVSGAALQGLFRNPLADPGLIGISSGAQLAVAIVIVLIPPTGGLFGLYGLSVAAFSGAIATSAVIFNIARQAPNSVIYLILAGIAINALTLSAVGFLTYLSDDQQLRTFTFWTMGSFGGALWPAVLVTLSIGIPAVAWLYIHASSLNRLLLGEQEASYLGTDVSKLKRNIILLTSVAVGVSVAMSGIIGFVGLVVPHLVRLLWKADHKILLPASALLGAILTIIADTLARSLVSPAEMPVGIITSMIGGPFFLWLLAQTARQGLRQS